MKCDVPTTACISENDDDAEGAMAIDVDNGKIGSAGLEFEKNEIAKLSQAHRTMPIDVDAVAVRTPRVDGSQWYTDISASLWTISDNKIPTIAFQQSTHHRLSAARYC